MSTNWTPQYGDKYNEHVLKNLIDWHKDDMEGHISEITKHQKTLEVWHNYPQFFNYLFERIRLEYEAYLQSKQQQEHYRLLLTRLNEDLNEDLNEE